MGSRVRGAREAEDMALAGMRQRTKAIMYEPEGEVSPSSPGVPKAACGARTGCLGRVWGYKVTKGLVENVFTCLAPASGVGRRTGGSISSSFFLAEKELRPVYN